MKENLLKVGFKEIEADIYIILLKERGISAYKISKILKKTKPQIYKALEIMLQKGMVYSNEASKAVEYYPTEIKTYLDWREKEFLENKVDLEEKVKRISKIEKMSGVFAIENISQMYSRSLEIIRNAKKNIIVMSCQIQRKEIVEELVSASQRGVNVIIETFQPSPQVTGIEVIAQGNSADLFRSQHYNWLEIFVDGEEFIISLMNDRDDQLYKCLWSNDPYLSIITYNANVGELLFAKMGQLLNSNLSKAEIMSDLRQSRMKYYIGIDMQKIKHLIF